MEDNKNKIHTVRFENFYKALSPNITTAKNGILFFNSDDNTIDNAMPQKLLDLRKKSSIHSFFLDLKASLIYASGLFPMDDNNQALNDFLGQKNRAGDSVQKVFEKCCADFAVFEQTFIEVIYDANGKIAELYFKPMNTVRAGECNEYGVPDFYYYSSTWGDVTNKRDKKKVNDVANAVKIAAFNPMTIGESEGRQIMHIKKYTPSGGEYPEPSYLSAEYWINVVYLIGQYVHTKFANGYFLDGFLYLNSNIPVEEQQKFVSEFERTHKGTEGKKLVIVFGDTAVAKPEFVPIQDSLQNSIFKDYMGEATKQIVFAHGGGLELLGLSNSDTMGNTNADATQQNVSLLRYIHGVIRPYESSLIEGFNRIFEVNGLGAATLYNDTLKLTVPELQPQDTTIDERREIVLGLPPMSVSGGTATVNNTIPNVAA